MTTDERIAKCEEICQDTLKTPYEKLAELCHYAFKANSDKINYDYIECPYDLEDKIYPQDVLSDNDICFLDLNSENTPIYNIFMPIFYRWFIFYWVRFVFN